MIDGSFPERLLVAGENGKTYAGLVPGCGSNNAHDSTMRFPPDDRQLTKVLVQCHEDPAVTVGAREDLLIAWIGVPVAGPGHIVAGSFEVMAGASPDAGIEEEPHQSRSMISGSTRSCATSR